jgi:hypothetical protein
MRELQVLLYSPARAGFVIGRNCTVPLDWPTQRGKLVKALCCLRRCRVLRLDVEMEKMGHWRLVMSAGRE